MCYLTDRSDEQAFISAVLSHAAGVFVLRLDTAAAVATGTAVDLVAGQTVTVDGAGGTVWTYTGPGAAFQIEAEAELTVCRLIDPCVALPFNCWHFTFACVQVRELVVLATNSNLAFRVDAGATVIGKPRLQAVGCRFDT